MKNTGPRTRMLDGLNDGWIEFHDTQKSLKGTIELESLLHKLVEHKSKSA